MSRHILLLSLLLSLAAPLHAEVLLLDAIAQEPPNSNAGLLRPRNGDTMQAVEARFGAPISTSGPVGDPAISSWRYPGFTVYFERNLAITTVVHR